MTNFEEMVSLFKKLELKTSIVDGKDGKFIGVIDNLGNTAEFTFKADGSFAKAGEYQITKNNP